MEPVLRPTTPDDAESVSTLRVAGWRTAYRGLVPKAVLDDLDPVTEAVNRREHWADRHAHPHDLDLVAEVDGAVVGWAVAGAASDPERAAEGELFGLYALPSHWSTGVGHLLLNAAEEHLRSCGYAAAHLWVLEGNERAAEFYERHGWREDGRAKLDQHGRYSLPLRRRVRDLSS